MGIKPITNLPEFSKGPTDIFIHLTGYIYTDLSRKGLIKPYEGFFFDYPQYFGHYFEHAKFRLIGIHDKYGLMSDYFSESHKRSGNTNLRHVGSEITSQIYWDFEDYLTTVRTTLDILTIICRPAYKQDAPHSFRRFCELKDPEGPHLILKDAKDKWAEKMINYRDQYVHYAPISKTSSIRLIGFPSDFEVHARIPDNPEVKNPSKFTHNNNIDLLKYSISTFNNMKELESSIATELYSLYQKDRYPVKK